MQVTEVTLQVKSKVDIYKQNAEIASKNVEFPVKTETSNVPGPEMCFLTGSEPFLVRVLLQEI